MLASNQRHDERLDWPDAEH
eukprot:IDg21254t1